MSGQKVEINRALVGVLTLACFAASLLIWLQWPDEEIWYAGFLRVGLLMGAFWFALPGPDREAAWANVSPWTFVGLILVVIALPRYPRIIIPLLAVSAAIGFFLRPRQKRRPPKS